jgi:hypothetical protein
LLAAWVEKIELAPEDLEIEIRYKVPEPVADRMGAGALAVAIQTVLAGSLVRKVKLEKKRRRRESSG